MPSLPPESESLWIATTSATHEPRLTSNVEVDVAIVGGGLTGLVAAYQLVEAGRSVAVLEKDRLAAGETGHTTAHLTELVDTRYSRVSRDFGLEGARLVAASSREAIAWIERMSRALAADAGFLRVPGFLYSERVEDLEWVREEMQHAREAGLQVEFTREIPLPFRTAGAMRVDHQARFHPRVLLLALVDRLRTRGVQLYEHTRVTSVQDGEPCAIETAEGATVTARAVIVAANVPINNRVALITKLPAYRTYAIGVRVDATVGDALFWDTDDPYHYVRLQPATDGPVVIVGGSDHKVGTEPDTMRCFAALADWTEQRFGATRVDYRWSGQIIEPVDGLPYIGLNTASSHVYVASGYSGNGMTFGTIAGLITSDAILRRPNPYAELYAATRVKPLAAAADFVSENLDFPKYLVRDRLTNADVQERDVAAVPPGEGRIVLVEGRKQAVYRAPDGAVHRLSPVCPHMGCDVSWNTAEESWDCPCHGSRFTGAGEVVNGPAVSGLERLQVERSADSAGTDDGS